LKPIAFNGLQNNKKVIKDPMGKEKTNDTNLIKREKE
jgi:hypothetical protein